MYTKPFEENFHKLGTWDVAHEQPDQKLTN